MDIPFYARVKLIIATIDFDEEDDEEDKNKQQFPNLENKNGNEIENSKNEKKLKNEKTSFFGDNAAKFINLVSHGNAGSKYGINHVMVSIGNTSFEWNSYEVVTIKEVSSKRVVFTADVGTIGGNNMTELFKKLANFIQIWNVFMRYDNALGDVNGGKGNCQQFADKLLEVLGLSANFPKLIRREIENVVMSRRELGFVVEKRVRENLVMGLEGLIGKEMNEERRRELEKWKGFFEKTKCVVFENHKRKKKKIFKF